MINHFSFTFYYDYFSLFLAHLALYYTNQKQKSFMILKKAAATWRWSWIEINRKE
jgi:hypothetical protein